MGVTDLNIRQKCDHVFARGSREISSFIRQKCDHVFEREVLEGLALLTFQSFD
jgi:hypothetical protein